MTDQDNPYLANLVDVEALLYQLRLGVDKLAHDFPHGPGEPGEDDKEPD